METKENTKVVVDMKDNESDDPTSWATLFCRLFAHVAKEVVEKFGDEGEQAIKDGVWAFGVERGRNIAERVRKNGCEINAEILLRKIFMEMIR